MEKTVKKIFTEELGDGDRETVCLALDEFAPRLGDDAAQFLLSYQETD